MLNPHTISTQNSCIKFSFILLKREFTNIRAGGLFITYNSQQSSSFDLPPINFKWHEGINRIIQSAPFQSFDQFVNELQDS